jgi:hypothetical protein
MLETDRGIVILLFKLLIEGNLAGVTGNSRSQLHSGKKEGRNQQLNKEAGTHKELFFQS